jgi:DNA repair protein RecN (Recombination protein N)
MLAELLIQDFVVARSLRLDLRDGFTSITGETGAGKSVILAALGFALGARARQATIRPGADAVSATACFELAADHPVFRHLEEAGFRIARDEPLVFRRTLKRGGSARAFINDQPASADLVHGAGALVADIHGQHEGQGLFNSARHRDLLDAFGGCARQAADVALSWATWQAARTRLETLVSRIRKDAEDRDYLAHSVSELGKLSPEPGETRKLALERATLQASERVAESLESARSAFAKAHMENALSSAARALSRALALPALSGDSAACDLARQVMAAEAAIERALIEVNEARAALDRAANGCEASPDALEASELRLFALRAAGRKFAVDPDDLAGLLERLKAKLADVDAGDQTLAAATKAEAEARKAYVVASQSLTERRVAAGDKLSRAVARELTPLKLGKSIFRVAVNPRPEGQWGPGGVDAIAFEIETVAGAGFAPLGSVASGGELARLSLALSVCLADASPCSLLVFDEADVGVGGAVAAAIGQRMVKLGKKRQVIAITHSPQVAALADRQVRIARGGAGGAEAQVLEDAERKEEIARMLAGAEITREARAAADRLLAGV